MSARAELHVDGPLPAAQALARGNAYARRCMAGDTQAAFYIAPLTGDAIALGRHQLAARTLASTRRDEEPVVRRRTGGRAVFAGDGVAYIALGLRHASVLMACPPDRVLNRNVRGALVGLSTTGVPTHYFGRDFLSVAQRPAIYAGWTRDEHGGVMLEMFASVEQSYVPAPSRLARVPAEPPNAKPCITLAEAYRRIPSIDELAERIVLRGYAAKFELDVHRAARSDDEQLGLGEGDEADARCAWSTGREVPIGFVESGLRLNDDGVIEDAAIAGDFFADESARQRLREALVGHAPKPERIAAALNRVYGPGGAVIEGLRSLQPLLEGFLSLGMS